MSAAVKTVADRIKSAAGKGFPRKAAGITDDFNPEISRMHPWQALIQSVASRSELQGPSHLIGPL